MELMNFLIHQNFLYQIFPLAATASVVLAGLQQHFMSNFLNANLSLLFLVKHLCNIIKYGST